jgi:hypothetical protein
MAISRRTFAAIALAVAIIGLGASAALAWNIDCSNDEACVWRNGPYEVPLAAKPDSDSDYSNNNYPNTQVTIDNSASSLRNKFDVHDVVWFFDPQFSGLGYCVNHDTGVADLAGYNDTFSSHIVAAGSSC